MKALVETEAPSIPESLAFTPVQQGSPALLRTLNLLVARWRIKKKNSSKILSSNKNEHPKMNSLTTNYFSCLNIISLWTLAETK